MGSGLMIALEPRRLACHCRVRVMRHRHAMWAPRRPARAAARLPPTAGSTAGGGERGATTAPAVLTFAPPSPRPDGQAVMRGAAQCP